MAVRNWQQEAKGIFAQAERGLLDSPEAVKMPSVSVSLVQEKCRREAKWENEFQAMRHFWADGKNEGFHLRSADGFQVSFAMDESIVRDGLTINAEQVWKTFGSQQ